MGSQLIWNERYNLGVDIVDREHKKLFSILNKLFDIGQQEEKVNGSARKQSSILKTTPFNILLMRKFIWPLLIIRK